MRVEVRSDGVHIEGYVNVTERESRAVMTPRGKVAEMIDSGAFKRAIEAADEIDLMVDHARTIGSTKTNLSLVEDVIGLRANLVTDDEEVMEHAKDGTIKGWSFGFRNAVDSIEERADKLPLRHISDLALDEVSLVINKVPCYSATSVEVRANKECDVESRACIDTCVEVIDRVNVSTYDDGTQYTDREHKETTRTHTSGPVDYTEFENRLKALGKEEV